MWKEVLKNVRLSRELCYHREKEKKRVRERGKQRGERGAKNRKSIVLLLRENPCLHKEVGVLLSLAHKHTHTHAHTHTHTHACTHKSRKSLSPSVTRSRM